LKQKEEEKKTKEPVPEKKVNKLFLPRVRRVILEADIAISSNA
jgi:hypothetical protein